MRPIRTNQDAGSDREKQARETGNQTTNAAAFHASWSISGNVFAVPTQTGAANQPPESLPRINIRPPQTAELPSLSANHETIFLNSASQVMLASVLAGGFMPTLIQPAGRFTQSTLHAPDQRIGGPLAHPEQAPFGFQDGHAADYLRAMQILRHACTAPEAQRLLDHFHLTYSGRADFSRPSVPAAPPHPSLPQASNWPIRPTPQMPFGQSDLTALVQDTPQMVETPGSAGSRSHRPRSSCHVDQANTATAGQASSELVGGTEFTDTTDQSAFRPYRSGGSEQADHYPVTRSETQAETRQPATQDGRHRPAAAADASPHQLPSVVSKARYDPFSRRYRVYTNDLSIRSDRG